MLKFSGRKQRFLSKPAHSWTPTMPKMKKTKKQRSRTFPSMGSVSKRSVTRMRIPGAERKSPAEFSSRCVLLTSSFSILLIPLAVTAFPASILPPAQGLQTPTASQFPSQASGTTEITNSNRSPRAHTFLLLSCHSPSQVLFSSQSFLAMTHLLHSLRPNSGVPAQFSLFPHSAFLPQIFSSALIPSLP